MLSNLNFLYQDFKQSFKFDYIFLFMVFIPELFTHKFQNQFLHELSTIMI